MSNAFALPITQEFETCVCYECGVVFAMTKEHRKYFLNKREKATFYCPNGHSQCYIGLSDAEKLAQEKARHQETLARLNAAQVEQERLKAEQERLKKRIKRGVCPCCKRSFPGSALVRHIKTKHPEFADGKV
jgi:hypothetical protein